MIISEEDVVISGVKNNLSISDSGCSGIKITHKKTGIFAECSIFRQQYKNKQAAIKMLKERLHAL